MDPQALGRYLRQTRETKELTLDQAESALKIRRRILESFEVGDFNLPEFAPIQIRGFVRNYARYLALDEDRVIAFYEESLAEAANGGGLSGRRRAQAKRKANKTGKSKANGRNPVAPRAITDTQPTLPVSAPYDASGTSGLRDSRQGSGLLGALMRFLVALAALAVIAFVISELLRSETGESVPTDPALADNLESDIFSPLPDQPIFTMMPTLPAATPTFALPLQPAFTGAGVLVTIELTQRAFLRISADGVEQFVGLMRAGDVIEIPANDNVSIISSNGEGLRIVYNGERQPIFGDRGQKVELVFGVTGVQVVTGANLEPTPELSPTPLPTSTAEAGELLDLLTPTGTPTAIESTPVALLPTADTLIAGVTAADPPTALPMIPNAVTITDTISPSPTSLVVPTTVATTLPSLTTVPPTLTATLAPSFAPSETLFPTATRTATATIAPSDTPIPTATMTASQTAILPPRQPLPGATPTKVR